MLCVLRLRVLHVDLALRREEVAFVPSVESTFCRILPAHEVPREDSAHADSCFCGINNMHHRDVVRPFTAAERGVFVRVLSVADDVQRDFLTKLTRHAMYV